MVLRLVGLGWFIIILSWTYLGEASSIRLSSWQTQFNTLPERKKLWQQKEKNALLQHT